MMKWMLCVFMSIRYVLCVVCDFDKHVTMFCVTGIDLDKRIRYDLMLAMYAS